MLYIHQCNILPRHQTIGSTPPSPGSPPSSPTTPTSVAPSLGQLPIGHPATIHPLGQRNAARATPLGYHVAQAMSPKQRALGADRRDDRNAPAGRQILNGVPKLRRVGYYVGRQHAQQPRSPNRCSLAARAISPYRVSPVHCRAPCLAPTSDSWHDRGLFRYRFETLNTAGQPVVPEIGNGVARPDRSATTSPKQRALRADR